MKITGDVRLRIDVNGIINIDWFDGYSSDDILEH